jgi:excisionase family DNA binding protein
MLTEGLYTVDEAAEQTRLKAWTIWDLLKRGKIMRTKVAGKTFVRESELRKLIVDQPIPKRKRRVRKAVAEGR